MFIKHVLLAGCSWNFCLKSEYNMLQLTLDGLRWSLGEAIFEAWISWPHFKTRGAPRGEGWKGTGMINSVCM